MINVQYAALDKSLNINFKKITMDSSQSQKYNFNRGTNLQLTDNNIKWTINNEQCKINNENNEQL